MVCALLRTTSYNADAVLLEVGTAYFRPEV